MLQNSEQRQECPERQVAIAALFGTQPEGFFG